MGLFDFFRNLGSKDPDPMLQAVKGLGAESSVDDFLEVARTLRAEGDPLAASHALRQGIATHGDAHELAFLRAECLLEGGRTDEAVRQYQDISDGWEDDLSVQRRCGRGLIACKAWDDAELQFHMASERFPDDAELYLIQGEAFEQSGAAALAVGLYTQAWELARHDGGIKRLAAERVRRLGGEIPGGAGQGRAASDSSPPNEAHGADGDATFWRLVCPSCQHVYRIGEDAVVVTAGALHDAAEFSVQIGDRSRPDLVGERVVGADERAEVQATVHRIRRDLEQGRRRQWWCGRCGNDENPHEYPWPTEGARRQATSPTVSPGEGELPTDPIEQAKLRLSRSRMQQSIRQTDALMQARYPDLMPTEADLEERQAQLARSLARMAEELGAGPPGNEATPDAKGPGTDFVSVDSGAGETLRIPDTEEGRYLKSLFDLVRGRYWDAVFDYDALPDAPDVEGASAASHIEPGAEVIRVGSERDHAKSPFLSELRESHLIRATAPSTFSLTDRGRASSLVVAGTDTSGYFVFDHGSMEVSYGRQAFAAIRIGLGTSPARCTFLDGDVAPEVLADVIGHCARVVPAPGRENVLAGGGRSEVGPYLVAVWTDDEGIFEQLHGRLCLDLADGYLGYMAMGTTHAREDFLRAVGDQLMLVPGPDFIAGRIVKGTEKYGL